MSARRRRGGAIAFTLAVVALALASLLVPDRLGVAGFDTPDSESARAGERLHEAFGYDAEPGMVVLARSRAPLTGPAGRAALRDLRAELERDPAVGRVQTPFERRAGAQVLLTDDRRAGLVLVHFEQPGETESKDAVARIDDIRSDSLALQFGGFHTGFHDDNRIVREDLLKAELIAFPLLALVLVFVFRGIAAALLPVAIGGLAVIGASSILRLLSQAMDLSVYSLNLAAALGLGLAVDYGLFIVSRYREERAGGASEDDAVQATMATAGRAVFYSGLTVAGACSALLLFPQQFIYSMGIGGMLTALLAAAAALVVVPPLLPRAGRAGRVRSRRELSTGAWFRFSKWVMRRAIPVAGVSAVAIVALGIPAAGIDITFLDKEALPPGLESRTVADAIDSEFVDNLDFPVGIAAPAKAVDSAEERRELTRDIAALPGAGTVSDVELAPDGTGSIALLPRDPPLTERGQRLVEQVRDLDSDLLVGGRIANFVDLKESIASRAVPALALVIVATLVILFLLTGSAVLPVKALLMNSLTLFAVFGVLVVVFQNGQLGLADLLGYTGPDAIETTMSVVIVAVTLGLATDYSILLLSRIREEHDAGQPNEVAVATGLERSGRVITNAALLLVLAFVALGTARVFLVQQLVIGIAIGVAIDATIVRACLVPSLMRILGAINWWAPRRLRGIRTAGSTPSTTARSVSEGSS